MKKGNQSKMTTNRLFFLMVNVGSNREKKFLLGTFSLALMRAVLRVKKYSGLILQTGHICLMMILLFLCTSCRSNSLASDPFYHLYFPDSSLLTLPRSSDRVLSDHKITLSASGIPLSTMCRILSDHFSCGLVFSASLSEKKIYAEFKDTSFSDVLNVLSRQLDSDLIKVGNTYYLGKLKAEDRSILVRKVLGFSNSDLIKACQGVTSDKGKVTVIGSGVVSATDYSSVIQRMAELLDYLSALREPVWIVQLAFLTINRDVLLEGGLKVSTSGTVSYNIGQNEITAKDFQIDGLLNAAMSSSFADVHSSPMLLVREGGTSEWKYGRRVPVPRKSVSTYGTVNVTGFDYIDVGFNVKASISRSSSGAILTLEIGKSDIESYVDTAPVTSQNFYTFTADLVPLRPYLLGELQTFTDLNKQTDVLNFGKTRGKQSVQVWGQIYRISPGVRRDYPSVITNRLSGD